jgi:N-methylhydantoinase A
VLSALGLCASDRRRDTARTVLLSGADLTRERIASEVAGLVADLGAGLEGAAPEVGYRMRYRGQAFELEVEGDTDPDPRDLAERFASAHEERYGYRDPEGEPELVDIRLAMVLAGPQPRPRAATGRAPRESERRARFGSEWLSARVIWGEPQPGLQAEGPAIFELPESTLVLPPGWGAEVDEAGSVVATAGGVGT